MECHHPLSYGKDKARMNKILEKHKGVLSLNFKKWQIETCMFYSLFFNNGSQFPGVRKKISRVCSN